MAGNNKTQRALFPSALRTASTACVKQLDYHDNKVRLYLNVSAASGSGGLTVQIRGYDKISGRTAVLFAASTVVVATGIYVYEMGSSANSTFEEDVIKSISRDLPVQWDVNVVHGDGSNYTYSLSAEVMP